MRRLITFFPVCFIIGLLVLGLRAGEHSLFAPYLGDAPPQILEIIETKNEDSIEITRLRFLNRTLPDNSIVSIYGILARPAEKSARRPAILVCHGGGATADHVEPAVKHWASLGYVAFCQDEPGIADSKKMRSTGYWGQDRNPWRCKPDPTRNQLYDGILAALNGFNLLRAQPDVDPDRIGVTGGSWGGYMTTMVSGLKRDRVKAAFAVYGGGFYDHGTVFQDALARRGTENRALWLKHFDAGNFAGDITASYFFAAAACDWFFWPPSVQATLDKIHSPKNLVFSPNTSHALAFPGGNTGPTPVDSRAHRAMQEIAWMDHHLKGEGKPFPICFVAEKPIRDGAGIRVTFQVTSPVPVTAATVWYSYGETPWRTRHWKKLECRASTAGSYYATLPVEEPDQPLDWFGLATDDRKISVSTSLLRVDPPALGFTDADRRTVLWTASVHAPDFDSRLWHPPYDGGYRGGRHRFHRGAFNGQPAIEITGQYALDCFGLRGLSLARDRSAGLSFWARSPGGTGFTVQLVNEETDAVYHVWEVNQPPPGQDWKEVRIHWSDFRPGPHAKPPMLSEKTAKLRIITPAGADLFFSQISAITVEP
ncbi:alpha/beta hydrolase family protein [Geminisphaera colitermitum]|uniref:alpha/beta hydrolase family protein n=1 Tax=Geminisphaera colitermitum TaxID=1148786 RepID=UPI000158D48F|nr:acetylxylan esterase [Geminisphaera colitermitum]